MLVRARALQDGDEELVALFVDAKRQTLVVLEQLAENGVGVAKSGAIDVVCPDVGLHQLIQSLE